MEFLGCVVPPALLCEQKMQSLRLDGGGRLTPETAELQGKQTRALGRRGCASRQDRKAAFGPLVPRG